MSRPNRPKTKDFNKRNIGKGMHTGIQQKLPVAKPNMANESKNEYPSAQAILNKHYRGNADRR